MNTEKVIYEILVRYGKNGEVQGMHIVYAFVVKNESDEIIAYNVGSPEAVALGIEQGLNLGEVLGDMNALNLVNVELLTNQLAQANAQIQSLQAEKSALIIARDNLKIEKENLSIEKNSLISENENLIQLLGSKDLEIESLKKQLSAINSKKTEEIPVEENKGVAL